VSIILLAWKRIDLLLTCLRSLADTIGRAVTYEVIVVSNDAPQAFKDVLRSQVDGIRLVEAQTNQGFGGGCNLGASVARGEYLVFLNDDCVVAPGWLDWLVSTADANPQAGAVGSVVLFPDGSIQEAGSVIWADGSTMPVGRNAPGDSLEWHFVRRVDYASACSLLVTRRAWDHVGGFDAEYYPAYYEDVDLCLLLQEAGYQVLVEPRSRAWHHESASSDGLFKSFLFKRNQRRLQKKWAANLQHHVPAEPSSPAALRRAVWRARGAPTQVLIIDDRVPDTSLGSGFGRMFTAALELTAGQYGVAIHPTAEPVQGTPPDALISAGVAIVPGDLQSHLACPWINYDVVIISRPHNFKRFSHVVRSCQPNALLIYDCEALFWRRVALQATLVTSDRERDRLQRTAVDMRALEERIVVESDAAVTVSKQEAAILAEVEGSCPITPLLPAETAVAFGQEAFEERFGVAYVAGWLAGTGSPNADGLRWFVADVLPLVRRRIPWLRVQVTGANPPTDLLELSDPNLMFVGHVADLSAFYGRTRVVISPIRFGSGVKLKTVQALQHGVPVVSTTCGAEGIDTFGLDPIAVADDPADFADWVVTLLTDKTQWEARRAVIADVIRRWDNDTDAESWPRVIADALARRYRGLALLAES
jgi:GT2 family glycosyltransferase